MNKHEYPNLGETLYEEVLPNGLSVLVAVKPGFRKNAAFFATRYGGADRRFKVNGEWIDTPAGVAHFLEHKMFDMPDGRNVLSDFAALGASPNAFTGTGHTAYYFTGSENFMENLRLLLTYVSTPYYTEESVAKEQGIIGQEICMGEDSPGYAGYFQLLSALYDHHPIRENIAGSVESIAQITPETLYHCHSVFYHPSNMVLCCVGDVDPEAIAAAAREILPDTPGEKPERDYGAPETLLPARMRAEKTMSVSAPQFLLGVKLPYPASGAARARQCPALRCADWIRTRSNAAAARSTASFSARSIPSLTMPSRSPRASSTAGMRPTRSPCLNPSLSRSARRSSAKISRVSVWRSP